VKNKQINTKVPQQCNFAVALNDTFTNYKLNRTYFIWRRSIWCQFYRGIYGGGGVKVKIKRVRVRVSYRDTKN